MTAAVPVSQHYSIILARRKESLAGRSKWGGFFLFRGYSSLLRARLTRCPTCLVPLDFRECSLAVFPGIFLRPRIRHFVSRRCIAISTVVIATSSSPVARRLCIFLPQRGILRWWSGSYFRNENTPPGGQLLSPPYSPFPLERVDFVNQFCGIVRPVCDT